MPSEVIFPDGIPNGTIASGDRILFSDTSDAGTTKDDDVANLPISTATQTALNGKQGTITLTTTGTSGPATLVGDTLNIPQYTGGGGGGAVDSVNGQTGVVVLDQDDIPTGTTNSAITIQEKKALIRGLSSGLLSGGVITQNGTNPNNIDISAGEGVVIDNTDPLNPVYTRVTWNAFTNVVLTNIATQPITNIYIDKNGNLQQGTLANLNSTRRQNVLLGVIEHILSPNIESIDNITALPYDTYVNLDEFATTIGRIKSNTFSTTGLNINLSAGTVFGIGDNKNSQNPNFTTFTAQNTISFRPTYRNGSGGWIYGTPTTSINNTQYDDGTGTLATLANNKATVHFLFWNSLSNTFYLQLGQYQYDSGDAAKAFYQSDNVTVNPLLTSAIFMGVVGIVKSGASVYFRQNSDRLGQFGVGGGSGGSATDLQSSYNISLPSAEITTNTTNGSFSIRGGTGNNADAIFEGKNNAGTITSTLRADGVPTASTDLVTKNHYDTVANGLTNALKSATTTVNVSSATAPTAGQVLTATSSTAATWQTPSGGSSTKTFDITIPGEQIADTSNFQGFYFYNNTGATITISNVAFAVGTAAAGTGAACAFNIYKSSGTAADGLNTNAVNLFTTAVDLGTGYTSLTNVPNTTTVENGRWVTARVTSSAGATNRASNAKIIVTYS